MEQATSTRHRPAATPVPFRAAAVEAADDGFGASLPAPPSGGIAAAFAGAALLLLLTALCVVEVPQRASATGVLMPRDGLIVLAAPEPAYVATIAVREGQRVRAGQPLLSLVPNRVSAAGHAVAAARLASVERELQLAAASAARRTRLQAAQLDGVGVRSRLARRRLELLRHVRERHARRLALAEKRLARGVALHRRGMLAADALDSRRLELLSFELQAAETGDRLALVRQELEELASERTALAAAHRLADLEATAAREQLLRRQRALEFGAGQRLEAPREAIVARIALPSGSMAQAGQTLVTLVAAGQPLEARLYVASADAGRLEAGQEVRLKLDGWPHQLFGAPQAVVTAVSATPLRPDELRSLPVAVPGPVFEVRAALRQQTLDGLGRYWQPRPGTAFRAQVVKDRYRLYRWLARSLGGG